MELALSLGDNKNNNLTSKSSFSIFKKGKGSVGNITSVDGGGTGGCGDRGGDGGGFGGDKSNCGEIGLGLMLNNNSNNNNNNTSRSSSSWSSSSSQENADQEKKTAASSSSSDPAVPIMERVAVAPTISTSTTPPPVMPVQQQLRLLPFSPVPRPRSQLPFPWMSHNNLSAVSSNEQANASSSAAPKSILEMNRFPVVAPAGTTATEEAEEQSSPNSALSSFMEFSLYRKRTTSTISGGEGIGNANNKRELELVVDGGNLCGGDQSGERGTSSRGGSDDDDNGVGGSARKKLRLSKEQSAFLEESFKEHHTLNPKQKLALAKQLNLRPRQVEVWFQNRRARTKLKQTEVDCEYLKRCCETLTDENRRLQKELQELRALKSSQPFYMHLPPTTLTMCPSCERVAATTTSNTPTSGGATTATPAANAQNITNSTVAAPLGTTTAVSATTTTTTSMMTTAVVAGTTTSSTTAADDCMSTGLSLGNKPTGLPFSIANPNSS